MSERILEDDNGDLRQCPDCGARFTGPALRCPVCVRNASAEPESTGSRRARVGDWSVAGPILAEACAMALEHGCRHPAQSGFDDGDRIMRYRLNAALGAAKGTV